MNTFLAILGWILFSITLFLFICFICGVVIYIKKVNRSISSITLAMNNPSDFIERYKKEVQL